MVPTTKIIFTAVVSLLWTVGAVLGARPVAVDDGVVTAEDTAVDIAVLANDTGLNPASFTVSGVTNPSHGKVVIRPDSKVVYIPNLNYTGMDSFTYTVRDADANTDTGTVSVTVTSVNDVPVAVNDKARTSPNAAVNIAVLVNDYDVDGDTLAVAIAEQGTHGTAVVGVDKTVTYTPESGFSGTDSFTYTISDGHSGTATGTVTVIVNSLPVATDDAAQAVTNTATAVAVLANDTDADNDFLTVTNVSAPAHGTAAIQANGTIRYTSSPGYSGSDSFTYTISDGYGGSDYATVTVTVAATVSPNAVGDVSTTTEDSQVDINVLTNDTYDAGSVVVTIATDPAHGTASVVGNAVRYVPASDYFGPDGLTYTITDTNGTATGSVAINVTSDNDAPVAGDDTATTDEDTAISISVLSNDTDADNDRLTVTAVTVPTHGTATIDPAGTVLYRPTLNYNGPDSFDYTVSDGNGGTDTGTVTITVDAANDAPVAVGENFTTPQNTAITVTTLLDNDSDADTGDTFSMTAITQPSHGTAVRDGNTVIYTPNQDFNGTDTFTYTITDSQAVTGTTTVLITVTPNADPLAVDDAVTTQEDTAVPIPVLLNDTGVYKSSFTVISVSTPRHGAAVINANGSITYTPDPGFHGEDGFTYTIQDSASKESTANVSVTVTAVNHAPVAGDDALTTSYGTSQDVAVLANDTDADGDVLTVTAVSACTSGGTAAIREGGVIRYTPASGYSGTDSFTYTVRDGKGGVDTATVSVTVSASTTLPDAVDDSKTTDEDTPTTITILSNDSDPDGDTLTVSGVSQPAHGAVKLNLDGTVTYTPATDYHGMDSFSYTITDDDGSDTATVSVTVNPINDAPIAVNDNVWTSANKMVMVSVLANDTDVDGDSLSVTVTVAPTSGTATVQSDKRILYVPNSSYTGNDTFTYQIDDGNGGTDTATVTVAVNGSPDAVNDTAQTEINTSKTISVLANDTDTNNDILTIVGVNAGLHGSLVINSDNTITYTPAAGFSGTDIFSYTISDGHGGTDSATVTVTVTSLPVALSVTLTYPSAGANFILTQTPPLAVLLMAEVKGYSATGSKVDFYVGSTKVGTADPTWPQCVWTPLAAGTYKIKAIATNSDASTATSNEVEVTVSDPPNAAPAIRITSPANGAVFTAGQNITLTVAASDTDGGVTKVEYYDGATKIGMPPNYPYSFTWTGATAGAHSLTAKATDNEGAETTSTAVDIVVNTLPTAVDDTASTVKDTPIDIDVLANDSDTDGDTLALYAIAQAPRHGDATFKNGKIHYAIEAGYIGTDELTYTIADEHGGKASAKVSITVVAASGGSATIQITDPIDGSTFAAGSDIPISVAIQEQGKAIVQVDYYQGSTKLGTATSSPFNFVWAKVPAGTYSLTAKATDSQSTEVTSNSIDITVNSAASTSPSIAITGPGEGSTFTAGDTITITASASDSDGTVASVEFYQGDTKLGTDTSSPYSFSWSSAPAGTYSLTAKATDNDGNTTTSVAVSITVNELPNVAPTVQITSPAESAIFTAGDTITFTVNTADTDGTVARVEVFQGNTKIGESTTNPFSVTWSNVPGGSYAVYARATDNDGDTGTSTPVNIVVNNPPKAKSDTASTVEGVSVDINVLANDSDVDGEAITLESAGQPGHGVTVIANKKVRYTPNPGFFGSDQFSYTVHDTHGAKSSAIVTVTVKAILTPPTIRITSPADGAVFTVGDNVPLTVEAGVKSGTITKVEFIKGTTVIGTVTSSPYSFTWSKPAASSYMLTARVTDSNGGTATSAPVTIVVNTPPVAKDDVATTAKGVAIDLSVLANDVDFDGDSLSIDSVTQPGHGTTAIVDNKMRYTPDAHYFGSDQCTYTVKDAHGGKATALVTINVTAAAKPFTVQITSPTKGTIFTAGKNIAIKADVPDLNVAISKIEFYQGSTLLGYDNTAPYQFTWTNVAVGNYILSVKAYDSEGRTSTSGSVSITVEKAASSPSGSGTNNGTDDDDSGGSNTNVIDGGTLSGGSCPGISLIILSIIAGSCVMIRARND